jgi:NADH:ubiquinone oxidoreductase subunit 6 (subunit J)
LHVNFCDTHFGGAANARGLYSAIGDSLNDIAVVSDNLYSTYGALFALMGVILTLALLAALTLLKR